MKNQASVLLRKNVFQFYASRMESCDEIYNMAEDKKLVVYIPIFQILPKSTPYMLKSLL